MDLVEVVQWVDENWDIVRLYLLHRDFGEDDGWKDDSQI